MKGLWWKIGLATVTIIVAREAYIAWGPRRSRRKQAFAQAKATAEQTGKPLLVVGSPDAGVVHRISGRDYGCGHICVDERGCGNCERQFNGPILETLARLPDNSAVVFVSDTLEYVADVQQVLHNLLRVSGGDLFVTTVDPVTLTAWFWPGARRRFFEVPPFTRNFVWKPLPWVEESATSLTPTLPTSDVIDVPGEEVT